MAEIELKNKDGRCFVCGSDNPGGMQVPFRADGVAGSRAEYTVNAAHTGWPGMMHGGLAFTLLDEAMAWAVYNAGLRGVTAKVETRFRAPLPVGTELVVTGRLVGRKKRLISVRGELRTPSGELMVESDATMFLMEEDVPR